MTDVHSCSGSSPTLSCSRVDIVLSEGCAAVEELAEHWTDLVDASTQATVFQSWAWQESWWRHYGAGRRLLLVECWHNGCLVGLLPLHYRTSAGRPVAQLVGTGISDFLDAIVRDGWAAAVLPAMRGTLEQLQGHFVFDLQELRPGSHASRLVSGWPGVHTVRSQSECYVIPAIGWQGLLGTVGGKRRETARRTMRRARDRELVWHAIESVSEVAEATGRWMRLHREHWRGRAVNREHTTRRFESHLARAAGALTGSGKAALHELRCAGEVVAADLVLHSADFLCGYLPSAAVRLRVGLEINTLFINRWLKLAEDRGVGSVNLGRGDEPYKRKWTGVRDTNLRITLS